MINILIQRSWLTNLGNGFIDKGARALIESVFPDANIFEESGYVHRAAYRSTLGSSPSKTRLLSQLVKTDVAGNLAKAGYHTYERFRNILHDAPNRYNVPFDEFVPNRAQQNVLNVSELISVDLIIIPDCVLTGHAFETFKPVLVEAQKNDIPIVFLGAGGGNYSPETREYVKRAVEDIGSSALITRDKRAYEYYSESSDFAHHGIDCAFFIDE